mgnify:CR=1 FL=1
MSISQKVKIKNMDECLNLTSKQTSRHVYTGENYRVLKEAAKQLSMV